MSLETGTFIDDLVITNPVSATDLVRYGAQHLQLIKKTVKNSFAGAAGAVMCISSDVGVVNAVIVNPAPALAEYTPRMLLVWRQANTNNGAVTYQATGLVTIPINSIAGIALVANDLIAGHVYIAAVNDAGTSAELIAVTKNYVDQTAFSAALPAQSKGILVSTGTVASFSNKLLSQLNFLMAPSVAVVASPDIWSGDGNIMHMTGSGTITSFPAAPQSGSTRELIMDGAVTLTNSANFVVVGGSYLTVAGDILDVTADTTTKFIINIRRVNGTNAATSSIAVNQVLTAASPRLLNYSPTVAGLIITAPDATLMSTDANAFTITNSGAFEIGYKDAAGNLITTIQTNGIVRIALTANGTAAGTWKANGNNISPLRWLRSMFQLTGGTTSVPVGIIQLSPSISVLITTVGADTVGTVYDNSTDTLGASQVILAGGLGSVSVDCLIALDSTHGFIAGATNSICFSVAGTVLTMGAAVATPTAAQILARGAKHSSTVVTLIARLGSAVQGRVFTISGVTITAGAWATIYTSGGSLQMGTCTTSVIIRSATQGIAFFADIFAGFGVAVHYTISAGTTITGNSNIANVWQYLAGMSRTVFMATDEWWFFGGSGALSASVVKLTVSGTTLTAVITGAVITTAVTMNEEAAVKVNANTIALAFSAAALDIVLGTLTTTARIGLPIAYNNGIRAQSLDSSTIDQYTGYGINASLALAATDESFASTTTYIRAILNPSLTILFRFSTKDVFIPNVPGPQGAIIDRSVNVDNFKTFSPLPAIPSFYATSSLNRGIMLGTSGKLSVFEVAI